MGWSGIQTTTFYGRSLSPFENYLMLTKKQTENELLTWLVVSPFQRFGLGSFYIQLRTRRLTRKDNDIDLRKTECINYEDTINYNETISCKDTNYNEQFLSAPKKKSSISSPLDRSINGLPDGKAVSTSPTMIGVAGVLHRLAFYSLGVGLRNCGDLQIDV